MTNAGRIRCAKIGVSQRADDEGDRGGHRPQAGLKRRQAEHQLQVLRDEDEDAEDDEGGEQVGAERCAEGGEPEQPQIDQRVGELALPADEDDADREAGDDGEQRRANPKPSCGDLLQAVDDREHAASDSAALRQVELAGVRDRGTRAAAAVRARGAAASPARRSGTPSPTRSIRAARRRAAARWPRRPSSW